MSDEFDDWRDDASELGLHGLLLHQDGVREAEWPAWLVRVEQEERARRSLERRIRTAKLGRFKPMADFDWDWPPPSTVPRFASCSDCASSTSRRT